MRHVVVLQQRLTHYRCALFEEARKACALCGIDLHLVHGQPSVKDQIRNDEGTLTWATTVTNRYLNVMGQDLVWQPFPNIEVAPGLVIITQENKLLSNYLWLIKRLFSSVKVAYWGHGRNFQSDNPDGLRERWKTWLLNKVDWWFAYTELTKEILVENGFPANRITVLNNAIDNERFNADLAAIDEDGLAGLRKELDLHDNGKLGLFCGSLYPEKKLAFMVEAAERIQAELNDFRLVVIGNGPSADELRRLIKDKPWARWVGVRKGIEKAAYFRLADVVLNPGLVGLHVLDAFCAGVPIVTTRQARHSPEIAYLAHNVNGLIISGSPAQYGDAVIDLLRDTARLELLKQSALKTAQYYTLDNMVSRFVAGIERCLATPSK